MDRVSTLADLEEVRVESSIGDMDNPTVSDEPGQKYFPGEKYFLGDGPTDGLDAEMRLESLSNRLIALAIESRRHVSGEYVAVVGLLEDLLQSYPEIVADFVTSVSKDLRPPVRFSRRPLSGRQRRDILERDAYRCQQCGGYRDLQIDHILPVSRGGGDDVENLQVLCGSCNASKGARLS